MPDYRATFSYKDIQEGITRKTFNGTFADATAAAAGMGALLAALQNATDAYIYQTELTEVDVVAGAANAGSTVFELVSATVDLAGKPERANVQLPSPVAAMMVGNALDKTAAQWTAVMAQITAGAGWTISDGDTYDGTVKGARVYRSSGDTNLPV